MQWNRAVHRIVIDRRLNLGAAARLLAAVHVSVGDATLACFDAKYHYRFWRPVHAITRADTDGNPATEPDPTWQPLLNVNHPEYPSGHACLTGAAATALRQMFHRDEFRYRVDSPVTGTTREYTSFRAAIDEASDARVWAGLHLRHSMHDGALIGQQRRPVGDEPALPDRGTSTLEEQMEVPAMTDPKPDGRRPGTAVGRPYRRLGPDPAVHDPSQLGGRARRPGAGVRQDPAGRRLRRGRLRRAGRARRRDRGGHRRRRHR